MCSRVLVCILLSGLFLSSERGLSQKPILTRLSMKIKYKLYDLRRRGSDWFWRTGVEDFFYSTTGGRPGFYYIPFYKRSKGRYFISSAELYYARTYRRGKKEKDPMYKLDLNEARKVFGEPSLVGYGKFSMIQENMGFGHWRTISPMPHHHPVLAAKAGAGVSLAIIDGLRGNSSLGTDPAREHTPPSWAYIYTNSLGAYAAGKVVGMLKADLQEKSLYKALLGIPNKLDGAIDKHIRSKSDHASRDEYRPVPANAGVFNVGAEITEDTMHVSHIGNGRLLLIRDGAVEWQTTDHNVPYRSTTGMEYTNWEDFKAIRITERMTVPLEDIMEHTSVALKSGDRIILASDSVWDVCSSGEVLSWVQGKRNEEATVYAREQIIGKIAETNEKAIQEGSKLYDQQFSLIVYDHDPNSLL